MTVEEMLTRMSSAELGEWQAYERAFGPLGSAYLELALAGVVDAVERLTYQTICLNVEEDDQPPVPNPFPLPPDIVPNEVEEGEFPDDDETDGVEY